jgi:hypothetical protein
MDPVGEMGPAAVGDPVCALDLLFESQPDPAARQSRKAQGFDRRPRDGESLIEEILDGEEEFEMAVDSARHCGIDDGEPAERQAVLIVIELLTGRAELNRRRQILRMGVGRLEGELMARNLGDAQSFEAPVLRRAPDGGFSQQITARNAPVVGRAELRFGLEAARSNAPQITALPGDQIRRGRQSKE